ncbi:peptidyl-tRNA hydrolase [Streptomyces sp. NPDC048389]|uniref:peptidyl-tRNA hydrolase n=1 Tax=Streptomyces sp. NPDC048389 TaxID=3154622 RepID=UPI0034553DB7
MTAGRLAGVSSEDTQEIRPDSPSRHETSARDTAPQFVLPLVVRIEKTAPPTRTDALETAARAVLAVLADERSTGDGEWAQAVRDWHDGRIRKVVRRARGAEWRKAGTLPGITLTGPRTGTHAEAEAGAEAGAGAPGAAEVRVFPPVPLDGWPRELAKLQVSGTELEDPRPPAAPDRAHPVLWLSPTLSMSAGKAMAQAGHGAQLAWLRLSEAQREAWRESGFALSVRTADTADWRALTASGLPVVRDAGFTEIAPGKTLVVEGVDRIRSLRRP